MNQLSILLMKKLGHFNTGPKSPDFYSSIPRHFLVNQLPRIKVFLLNFNFVSSLEFGYSFILKYHYKTSSYSSQRKIILTMLSFFSGKLGNFYQYSLILSSNLLEITKHYRNMEPWVGIWAKDINKKGVEMLSFFFTT